MERLDPEMRRLAAEIRSLATSSATTESTCIGDEKKRLEDAMRKREELLAPMYHQVAVNFADLHDTPVRMKDKGVIRDIVEWEEARKFLYWRLRRRLLENQLTKRMKILNKHLRPGQKSEMLRRWFIEDQGEDQRFLWEQDQPVVEWLLKQQQEKDQQREGKLTIVMENLKALHRDATITEFKTIVERCPTDEILHQLGVHLVQHMSSQKRAEFLEVIQNLSSETTGSKNSVDEGSNSGDIGTKSDSSATDDSSENGES